MLIHNSRGLPDGNTDDPELITEPRGGVPAVIDTPAALAAAARTLEKSTAPTAIDVERASGFRYSSKPYLVQIRKEGSGLFLIDTAALPDLSPLAAGLTQPWILHDALQDLPNLRQSKLKPRELFDTQLAAKLLGFQRFGLGAVCEKVLGLTLLKDHQAADWSVRPLPKDWLRYAALDVELLGELYNRMAKQLFDLGRWDWAKQENAYLLKRRPSAPKPEPWRHIPGAGNVRTPRQLAILRSLWEARERIAQRIDIAPGRLVRNSALITAATSTTRTKRSLKSIAEFRSPVARQFLDDWMRAIHDGFHCPDDQLPTLRTSPPPTPATAPESAGEWSRVDPQASARLTAVREAVHKVAASLSISPAVLLEARVQRHVAWAPLEPQRPVLAQVERRLGDQGARPWQITLTAHPIATALT